MPKGIGKPVFKQILSFSKTLGFYPCATVLRFSACCEIQVRLHSSLWAIRFLSSI